MSVEQSQSGRPMNAIPRGARRPLRIFPFDPMLDRFGRSVIADVPYEKVYPGPSGRLVEVVDYDATRDCFYQPIDLDDPAVLVDQGLDLAEYDPRFHQQMVYTVVMRVLEAFERGLGRPFRWRGRRRLRVYPHAFAAPNAYFDEDLFALLFGYFTADPEAPGPNLPGQPVFTCLSHDVVAHETGHAVLQRLRPLYSNPTNPDVLAFHEGFADIVAILQHFTYRDVVDEHIRQTRANLAEATPMLSLASQFGFARGSGEALRTALVAPDPRAYERAEEEHDRGALLSAAVIAGFLRSYERSIGDLVRIATTGSGVLQPGALHPDLVQRLRSTVGATAERILTVCIRAFDYLPPCDVTFGDYLRAVVTADFEISPEDRSALRSNLIESFRGLGIHPTGVTSLAERSLRIPPADPADFQPVPHVRDRLLDAAREFELRRRSQTQAFDADFDEDRGAGGSDWASDDQYRSWATKLHGWAGAHRGPLGLETDVPIAVTGFHSAHRVDSDGYVRTHVVLQLVQRDPTPEDEMGGIVPVGGATVIADSEGAVRYVIGKRLPTANSVEMRDLREFAARAEHRIRSAAWSGNDRRRIISRLNLRSLDAPAG